MHLMGLVRKKFLILKLLTIQQGDQVALPAPVVIDTLTVGFPLESSLWDAVTAEIYAR